jgi:cytochrome b pre-mRNA-processing protein 3
VRIWPFQPSLAETDAARLLAAVTAASRRPDLFGENRVPDTLEGRFEMLALHAALALRRLRTARAAPALGQAFVDQVFSQLDAGLREDGVGDLSVAKRMRVLAGAFYGRVRAYDAAWEAPTALAAALARNVAAPPFAASLAAHALALAARQAELPLSILLTSEAWTLPD